MVASAPEVYCLACPFVEQQDVRCVEEPSDPAEPYLGAAFGYWRPVADVLSASEVHSEVVVDQ